MSQRPIETSNRHIDGNQRSRQKRHFALKQTKAGIDIPREGIEEAVNDGDVVHGVCSAGQLE